MTPRLEYKGYCGTVEVDIEGGCLFGTVEMIRDTVHYEGETVAELRQAFRDSIDVYIDFCGQRGEQPDVPAAARSVA